MPLDLTDDSEAVVRCDTILHDTSLAQLFDGLHSGLLAGSFGFVFRIRSLFKRIHTKSSLLSPIVWCEREDAKQA